MRGPWFIGEHFLSIRLREPFSKPSTANVSLIAVWVRICELPIELYDVEVLKQISKSIGKVLRIVSPTAMEARGKYARLCIQIDVNKPLVSTILIGHFEQIVPYEGIHSLRFSCGRLGHRFEACPYNIKKGKESLIPTEEMQSIPTDTPREKLVVQNTPSAQASPDVCELAKANGRYGPWMVVTRKAYR